LLFRCTTSLFTLAAQLVWVEKFCEGSSLRFHLVVSGTEWKVEDSITFDALPALAIIRAAR
jgi:hypothetical protein